MNENWRERYLIYRRKRFILLCKRFAVFSGIAMLGFSYCPTLFTDHVIINGIEYRLVTIFLHCYFIYYSGALFITIYFRNNKEEKIDKVIDIYAKIQYFLLFFINFIYISLFFSLSCLPFELLYTTTEYRDLELDFLFFTIDTVTISIIQYFYFFTFLYCIIFFSYIHYKMYYSLEEEDFKPKHY